MAGVDEAAQQTAWLATINTMYGPTGPLKDWAGYPSTDLQQNVRIFKAYVYRLVKRAQEINPDGTEWNEERALLDAEFEQRKKKKAASEENKRKREEDVAKWTSTENRLNLRPVAVPLPNFPPAQVGATPAAATATTAGGGATAELRAVTDENLQGFVTERNVARNKTYIGAGRIGTDPVNQKNHALASLTAMTVNMNDTFKALLDRAPMAAAPVAAAAAPAPVGNIESPSKEIERLDRMLKLAPNEAMKNKVKEAMEKTYENYLAKYKSDGN
jgi:hypothetical protein